MNKSLVDKVLLHGIAISVCLVSGCVSTPQDPDVARDTKVKIAKVARASGIDYRQLKLADEARRVRVYVQLVGVEDPSTGKMNEPVDGRQLAYLNREIMSDIGLSNVQLTRRFLDAIIATRRFDVYSDNYTGLRDKARQIYDGKRMDIFIEGQVVGAMQDIIDISPYKKVVTTVRMSFQMRDAETGENLFPAAVAVTGDFGKIQGEGTLLAPGTVLSSPELKKNMSNDYERALEKAFQKGIERISNVLRPVGRVTAADEQSISFFGGSRNGFQSGDSVIVVEVTTTQAGERTQIKDAVSVAAAVCDGVGTDTSQCDIRVVDPVKKPKPGDYVVLTDHSASDVREK